jgi:hypothetical protein
VNEKGKDRVSCLKGYFTQLVIFEVGTTWSLSGTSFDNYVLAEVSPIYGCLSSRGACVWKQNLWFLDKQGICEFNGANTQIVSNKVQPYFDRMNVAAARTEAIMLHVKDRNEVWCAIPIDGASRNNLIVVYDYLSDAWYTRETPNELSALALISLGNNKQLVYSGSASGTIHSWGSLALAGQWRGLYLPHQVALHRRFGLQCGEDVPAAIPGCDGAGGHHAGIRHQLLRGSGIIPVSSNDHEPFELSE